MLSAVITVLFVIVALLLIGIVLIQQPKTSGGLFAGTGQSLLGTSGKTFWTKFTTILAAVFMALCLLMAAFPKYQTTESPVAEMIEKQQQQAVQQAAPVASPAAQAPKAQSNPAPQKAPESTGSKK
jgi:preprotein translocase subunit SecG